MKKISLLIFVLFSAMTIKSFGQKLEENKTDDFTKQSIKRTSWETLVSNFSSNMHFRASTVADVHLFEVKIMIDKPVSISKDQELMLKMDDGNIIELKNDRDEITCRGCGAVGFKGSEAWGVQAIYPVDKEQLEKLNTHSIVKIRIQTIDGYLDEDIKDKVAKKIKTAFSLI